MPSEENHDITVLRLLSARAKQKMRDTPMFIGMCERDALERALHRLDDLEAENTTLKTDNQALRRERDLYRAALIRLRELPNSVDKNS